MREPAVIGVDLGTTGVKVGVFGPEGEQLGLGAARYPLHHPVPGAAEQDPADWWAGTVAAVREALSGLDVSVAAITVVAQGPSMVAVDEAGDPVRPAICWMDTRAHTDQSEMAQVLGIDGFLLGYLPKIAWMLRQEPAAAAATRWYLTAWDYLAFRLGARPVTAMSISASRATPEMAARAGLDADRVPPPVDWATVIGAVTPEVAGELGISDSCAVVAGGMDALSSYVGSGITTPGQSLNNGGTSGGFAAYWYDDVTVPGVYLMPAVVEGFRLFGTGMAATGLSFDWLARIAGPHRELLDEAAAVGPGADGLVYLPYLAGERSPLWDADARGVFVGLSAHHRRGHLARAVLEASGYAIRHVTEPMIAAGVEVTEMRVCGGAAASALWNQIKADVTGFTVTVPETLEGAALGAGILGAVGVGLRPGLADAMNSMVRITARFEPRPEAVRRYDELFGVYRDLYPALKPSFDALAMYRSDAASPEPGRAGSVG